MEEHFTKVLKEKLKGLNLSQLSRELNIPSTLLFEWKAAKRHPSFKNIVHVQKLADYFGMSLEELLLGTDSSTLISTVMFQDRDRKYRIKIERLK